MTKTETGSPSSSLASPRILADLSANGCDEDNTIASCTSCGSTNVRFVDYDYGCDSETGYSDAGEGWRCLVCDALSTECDELPIIPNGIFRPTIEDKLRWSLELVARASDTDWPGDTGRDEGGMAA